MSSGHHDAAVPHGLNSQALDRLLEDRAVREELWRHREINREFDLPYLGGYSKDGATIYIDCHLPEKLSYDLDGRKKEFAPDQFLRRHEALEKTLIDVCGYSYEKSHQAATAYEKRGVLERLGPGSWEGYSKALDPFIKADQVERLESVPADLDMTPYWAPPVNHTLIARMQAAMGAERRYSKAEAAYSDTRGVGSRHCGPVRGWPTGDCEHFEAPRSCALVRGAIAPRGGCRLWEAKN